MLARRITSAFCAISALILAAKASGLSVKMPPWRDSSSRTGAWLVAAEAPFYRWLVLLVWVACSLSNFTHRSIMNVSIGPLLLVHEYGVNVPYWDQWDMVNASLEARQGGIPPSLFAQHMEHRIVVPRLVYIVLDNLTHWNQFALMRATFVIVCVTSLGVFRLAKSTIPDGSRDTAMVIGIWFVCNLLIFSPAQHENWLWGVGVENALPMLFIVWGMIAARSSMRPWGKMAICLVLATAATFSSGNGFLAWPLIGLLWLWSPSFKVLKEKKWLLLAWCAGFAINLGLYARHYANPPGTQTPPGIVAMVLYVVAFVAAPFAVIPQVLQATIIGVPLLILLAFGGAIFLWEWWIEGDYDFSSRILVWLAVAGFAVGSGVMAAPHRSGSGTWQALSSRYSTFALYLTVALLNLCMIVIAHQRYRKREWARHLVTSLITAILIVQVMAISPNVSAAREIYRQRMQAKAALLLIRSLPDDDTTLTTMVFPHPERLRQMAEALNQIGFIHPPLIASDHLRDILLKPDPKVPPVDYGVLDHALQNSAGELVASGWAIFHHPARPADAVFLTWDRFDDDPRIFAVCSMGESRDDVAVYLREPRYALSGWSVSCPVSRLPAGAGRLRIRAWALDLNTCKAAPLYGDIPFQR